MRLAALALALTAALFAPAAHAVTQPDGTVIPVGTDLANLFSSRGETIDAVGEAAITPERFVPGCRLTFTLVTRAHALFQNAFGWYNVTGAAPSPSDLHVLIPCGAPAGFVANLDLRSEPSYRGGEIGFFLQTPESRDSHGNCAGGDCCGAVGHDGYTYFTEREFNPDNAGANSYKHLLIYDSHVTAQSFYFAWEDLYSGGDNNFADFVALVSNIVCSGAGAVCDTGHPGVCAAGTQQCHAGALQCVQSTQPSPERCDGLDNDCNGMTDDGTGLCPADQVCDRGACVPRCVEGGCFEGQTCNDRGACVETSCVSVTCPDGQVCHGGACVGACDAVVCPGGQTCRAGRCVDPCAGVTCDADQACVAGVCQPVCQCRRCADGQTCGSDGRCVETACSTVTCAAGTVCTAGMCRDACEGAHCPAGQACQNGECSTAQATDGGTMADAGLPDAGSGSDASAMDVASDVSARDVAGDAHFTPPSGGCGCRAARRYGSTTWGAWFALASLCAARRRKRTAGR